MNKQIIFRAVLGVVLLRGCMPVDARPPTCAHPLGKWNDEVKSVIEIETYDTATGAISGEYISRSGAGSWPVVGWINSAPAESSAPGAQISTLWHTARPNTRFEWEHILTGPEVLVPIE